MTKNILISAALLAATVFGAAAQEKIYLVKGDHVVGKYDIDEVDYATFKLPEGVIDAPVWINIDKKTKNSISYTVNTTNPNSSYVHSVMSEPWLDSYSLSQLGDFFEALNDEDKSLLIKTLLPYADTFVGQGKTSTTVTDFMQVGGFHMNVMPGIKHYVVAWPIDSDTEELSGEEYAVEEVSTDAPGQSSATFSVDFIRQNREGLAFNFSFSDEIMYVRTIYGVKDIMEKSIEFYGKDQLFAMFGAIWSPSELTGFGEVADDIENATWPVAGDGEYIMIARAYDANGDMVESQVVAVAEAEKKAGPVIKIFSKEATNSGAIVNFEITPSNVEEAYVRVMGMNDCDDRLNMGYEYHELAMGGDATEITSIINTTGEYTLKVTDLDEGWYSILIYAKNDDGRTTQRLDFYTEAGSIWGEEYDPKHAPARVDNTATHSNPALNPSMNKISK